MVAERGGPLADEDGDLVPENDDLDGQIAVAHRFRRNN